MSELELEFIKAQWQAQTAGLRVALVLGALGFGGIFALLIWELVN